MEDKQAHVLSKPLSGRYPNIESFTVSSDHPLPASSVPKVLFQTKKADASPTNDNKH